MLRRLLPTTALLALALTASAGAEPRARTAAERNAVAVLAEAEQLRDGRGVRTGRELTDALRELSLAVRHLRDDALARASVLLRRPSSDGPAVCSQHFCVHGTAGGTLTPDIVAAEAEKVHAFHTGTLAWRKPPSDGDGRVDIYLQDVGADRLFGYAETEPGDDFSKSQPSFLVLDDDFDPAQFGGMQAMHGLRVTLAHEYGHVLQYGYDVTGDGWHYESSATWLEHRMYPDLDDWLRFVEDRPSGPGWRSLTELPLTAFDAPADKPRNAKPYGSVVWNHFLSNHYGPAGDALQRDTWDFSNGFFAPSTDAHDQAIDAAGGQGLAADFAAFAAAVAEWRVPAGGFPLSSRLPDVERRGRLTAGGAPATLSMDHLTFALYDVPRTSASQIRLGASFPAGTYSALALVARRGSADAGAVATQLATLPAGGTGGVTLDQPDSYLDAGGRVTAVLVNADARQRGYDNAASDWLWSHDDRVVSAEISSDLNGPAVATRSPAPGARGVRPRSRVRVSFSRDVTGVDERSFSLRRPGGRRVPATVRYARRTRTATLTPAQPLADTTKYTVRLTRSIIDRTATRLVPLRWSFRTLRQAPRATVRVSSATGRTVGLRMRSRDRDRLRWRATLVRAGRTVGRRSGRVAPGATRFVKVRAETAGRMRVLVVLRDPQGNRRRLSQPVRVRP